ncbi:MAG TPA: YqiA/YcfP family alpha/beta fold hydrolase [Thermoanaerobaculia bacterium]|nr:YqiA/YcfP family alpha/beta fold hydrolase [Thermoanaerobaculia bacterium]
MIPAVLYIHGFASSPQSSKLVALERIIDGEIELNAPDMNVPSFEQLDFEAMTQLALAEAHRRPPRVIVGSSLGALVALEAVRRGIRVPLVLIAPAVGIGERWRSKLPPGDPIEVFNHARNAQAPIHRAFFETMAAVQPEHEAPEVPVTILMGRNDESVPFSWVRNVWEEWTRGARLVAASKFIEIAGGDHGLVAHVETIANEIRAAVK